MRKLLLLLSVSLSSLLLAQSPPQIPLGGNIGVQGSVAILGGTTVQMPADANYTITPAQWSNKTLVITSAVTLTATRNIIAPLNKGQEFNVENSTTGAQSITIIGASGTGITIASGTSAMVFTDGTNYLTAASSGGGANFPATPGVVCNTSTSASVNCPSATMQTAIGSGVYDASGAAAAAQTAAQTFASNASNLSIGTVPISRIPLGATSSTAAVGNDARFGASTIPVPSQIMPITGWTAYHPFGDSITANTGCSSAPFCYVALVAAATGTTSTLTNYGVGNDMACDLVNHVFNDENPGATSTTLYTMMVGVNDGRYKLVGQSASNPPIGGYKSVYQLCHKAALAWLTTSSTSKYTGASFGSVPTNWALDATFAGVTGLKSTTLGAVSTWPFTLSTYNQTVFVFYRLIDGNGGQFVVSINSQTYIVNNYTTPAIATANGATSGVGVWALQFPNTPAGSYSLTISVHSATGAGNIVSILGVGVSPAPGTAAPSAPTVWAAGVPRQEFDTLQSTTQAYNDYAYDDVNQLQNLGLPVNWVDVRSFWTGLPATMYDNVHPNDAGHREIANAFLAQPAAPPTRSGQGVEPVDLNRGLPYTSYWQSLPARISPEDGEVYINNGSTAGNVYMPSSSFDATNPSGIGKRFELINFGTAPLNVIDCCYNNLLAVLPPSAGYPNPPTITTFENINGGWAVINSGFYDPTLANNIAIPSATTTLACANQLVVAHIFSAVTFTLPTSCPNGKAMWIANGVGNFYPLSIAPVAGMPSSTYVLQPNQGIFVEWEGSFGWQVLGSSANIALTKCANSASPAACGNSPAGVVQVAAAGTTLVVNTTAAAATGVYSLSYTTGAAGCSTAPANIASLLQPYVSSITDGVSFTITLPVAPTTNPACIQYAIN